MADAMNHRIQVFTSNGQFLRMFGKYGDSKGELKFPIAVAVDMNGFAFVSDLLNKRIVMFDPTGRFVTQYSKKKLFNPHGLTVDKNGVVYMCDYKNGCVQLL